MPSRYNKGMKATPREVERTRPITWSRKLRELQTKLFSLDSTQEKVLFGTLLGDGCLISNAYGKNYRLQIAHATQQKKYVEWKHQVFNQWCLSKPKFQRWTDSWQFRTISHPVFTGFHRLFYHETKKILPCNIEKIFVSPLSLAVWFMDDGTRGPTGGFTINTQNFTREENEILREVLKKNFGLETSLHRDRKYVRIYILPRSRERFIDLVEQFTISELKYKLFSLTP
ncbi:MAG: hypothetical protein HYV78_00235 [Candidatus Wildermuthbacteria bacterium]|nr:hypothetical protein [Candidatus Wildermuthbacteria bacterium]